MLYRLIVAIFAICTLALPAVAQSKPDCSKIETKSGQWVADKVGSKDFKDLGDGKCERHFTCGPSSSDSGRKKATLGDFLGCVLIDTPAKTVGGVCNPKTGPCNTCDAKPPGNCTVNLVKR
jgi:hypothetical protein